MKDLPDKNEWKKITEEAFTSSEKHIFSESYRKQRDVMLNNNDINNETRKRIRVKEGGRRRKWAAPLAGAAAAVVIIPGVLFGTGLLSPSTGVPTTDITETEPAAEIATEQAAEPQAYPDTEGCTYRLDWLPEGVYYDAAEDMFFSADGTPYMKAEIISRERDTEAEDNGYPWISEYIGECLKKEEVKQAMYKGALSLQGNRYFFLVLQFVTDVPHETAEQIINNASLVPPDTAADATVSRNVTCIAKWLPDGVYYDAEKDAYYDAEGRWYATIQVDALDVNAPAGSSIGLSVREPEVIGEESTEKTLRYKSVIYSEDGGAYIVSMFCCNSVEQEDLDRIAESIELVDAETGLAIQSDETQAADGEEATVVFPAGCTIYDAAIMLEEYNFCKGEDFTAEFNSCRTDMPEGAVSDDAPNMEGFILSGEYTLIHGMTAEGIAKYIRDNTVNDLAANGYIERAAEKGMTLGELMTLASIVEKESPTTDTMCMIAETLENRLADRENFPHLCADSTRAYAENSLVPMTGDSSLIEKYDTYTIEGLPPAPICSPSTEAIEAVLGARISSYYYYCTDMTTGRVYFAKTPEEHEQNMEIIRQMEAEISGGYTDASGE